MDILINKENRLSAFTPNVKKDLLKSVKKPLGDVQNVLGPKDWKSPGFDGCSKSPLKEMGEAAFDDLKYILKQSEYDAPVEGAFDSLKIKSISPVFDSNMQSIPDKLDEDTSAWSDYFLKYEELDVPDDFHDIMPRQTWPNKDELNRFILGYCESYEDSEKYVQDLDYIQFEPPVDNDYIYEDDNMCSISEVSFGSSIDFDMLSDDD